ncbi:hypothetical protein LH991_04510 [Schleiferilactobacillus harbinensis]|nr:acyltransferase domain-containing protein [Schleiferilactobacillus harbinensis]QFR63290.1 hypothetical protein LH991_04510 [Schleiferilactobacillus harbinensis]
MQLQELCQRIDMPESVTTQLVAIDRQRAVPVSRWQAFYRGLAEFEPDEAFYHKLLAVAPDDALGFNVLWQSLNLALQAADIYRQRSIADEIYAATMGFFSRTVKEGRLEQGMYCFPTRTWGIRQLQLREFRLGTLEFEKTPTGVIEIHIPSDADLDQSQRLAAYAQARQFWGPAYTDYECFSWLLSPVLKQILPAKSHILQFQSDFRIERWDKEQGDYRKWIFHNSQAPIADLPETTSLQRSVKQLLLSGGTIGAGVGKLIV